jgi:phosphoglycolate phosphatase-like HAD superfamily hydrolase
VGDSPQDMRLGAEHGVPIRIGVDRDGDPRALFAAGATHVVRALAEIVSIVATAPVRV